MTDYRKMVDILREDIPYAAGYPIGLAYRLTQAADVIEELCAELRMCRNELCLKCGNYHNAHKGACDGCRWKECPW